jgi:GMP synthase-like glutamine amidotransferase
MRHIPPQALVAQDHSDTFEVPEGAVDLARSTNRDRPHSDAFHTGGYVYGLRFHPDIYKATFIEQRCRRKKPPAELLAEVRRSFRDPMNQAVFRAWLNIAVRNNAGRP